MSSEETDLQLGSQDGWRRKVGLLTKIEPVCTCMATSISCFTHLSLKSRETLLFNLDEKKGYFSLITLQECSRGHYLWRGRAM